MIPAGSLTAVVGPNGAGKSTLLKAVAGALRPLDGRIEVVGGRAKRLAYLPQAAEIDRSFPVNVYDLVAMGLWGRVGLLGGIGRRQKNRIEEAIAAVGLTGFERRSIGTLSGGQMQRALFARLLLQDAALILLDEPFTAIDAKTTADLLDLVRRWHAEERTVVAVLHDLDVVKRTFPDTLLIAREPVAWGETGSVLSPENLLRARRMVEAHDPHASACGR
jgi:zinc/manganese transport system ATP-binding protein